MNIKSRFFSGIGKRFWAYASLLLVISELMITSGVLVVVTSNEKESLRERYVNKTENMYYAFDVIYQNLDTMTEDLITNTYIQQSLTDKNLNNYDYEMIQRTLFCLNNDYISYYYYFDNQDNVYTQKNLNLEKDGIQDTELTADLKKSYAKTTLMRLDTGMLGIEGERFLVGRYVRHLTQNREPGILFLVLKDSLFTGIADVSSQEQSEYYILDASGSSCYRIGEDGEEVSASLENHIKKGIRESGEEREFILELSEGMLCCRRHETTGFVLASFVPKSMMNQVQRQVIGVILIIAAAVLCITALVASYFSHRLSRPIRKISEQMTNFNMDSLTLPLDIHTNTELDDISNAYNEMLIQIDRLLEQIKSQQEELKNIEMESLLYQIHPHFLYNTLGNIYMLARLNGEETMMQMIDSLSKFLRLTLSNGEEMLTVEKELEHVCAYMEILRIRNDDMFRYTVECEETVKQKRILKLILQPLAENAIKHGFADIDKGGLIQISIRQEENRLHCRIRDNGCGISGEVLNRINHMEEQQEKQGIGIYNVVYRLKLKYGNRVHFWYESVPGDTTGHITIEMESGEEEQA